MKQRLIELQDAIASATGRDEILDQRIAHVLDDFSVGDDAPNYTGSVDACIALIGQVAPHWHWHVGHGPSGVLPYAALTMEREGEEAKRVEYASCTVPLALLGALIEAKLSEGFE